MSIAEQTEQAVAVPAGTFHADTVHSSVAFEVEYMGIGKFGGSVKDFDASLVDGRLTGAARIASLETKDENLSAHLMSPEFFDADNHPEVSFSTGEVSTQGGEIELTGEITIRGISRPATLRGTLVGPVTDPYGNERYGLKLETTVDRTAFGIDWNSELPNGAKALADDVTLKADLALVEAR